MTHNLEACRSPYNYSTDHSQRQHSPSSQASFEDSSDSFEVPLTSRQRPPHVPIKRRKTELCRNYESFGYCKFRDKCAFAHGKAQLQDQPKAQTQTTPRPCKKYFTGFCPFGERCQYLHREIVDLPQHRDFVEKTFRDNKLMVPLHPTKLEINERFDLQRFHHLYKIFGRKLNFKRDDLVINICRKRLSCFENLCTMQDFDHLLSKSRKQSEQN